jgi:YbbR domain-containing protein
MFQGNIGLKIVSALLALFIWIQAALITEQKTVINIPVSMTNIPKDRSFGNLPSKIPFNVKGLGFDIIKLYLLKPSIMLDAQNIKPGVDKLVFSDYQINIPENLNVELLGPVNNDEITVHSDVFHRKNVSVNLSFADKAVQSAFTTQSYKLFPDQVQIFGPKNKVNKINAVSTHRITQKLMSQKEFKIDLINPDGDVSLSTNSISIVIINEDIVTKVFGNITIEGTASQKIVPSRVTIKLQGSAKTLATFSTDNISATLDTTPDSDGMYEIKVAVPEDVILVDITPTKVFVK